jgi:hypothetical protein
MIPDDIICFMVIVYRAYSVENRGAERRVAPKIKE